MNDDERNDDEFFQMVFGGHSAPLFFLCSFRMMT